MWGKIEGNGKRKRIRVKEKWEKDWNRGGSENERGIFEKDWESEIMSDKHQ